MITRDGSSWSPRRPAKLIPNAGSHVRANADRGQVLLEMTADLLAR